jgi:hypothetical protein
METGIISLEEASKILSVPVETLLRWNEYNILKPTITATGGVGYRKEQIDQFVSIQKISQVPILADTSSVKPNRYAAVLALVLSFVSTVVVAQAFLISFQHTDGAENTVADVGVLSKPDLSRSTPAPLPIPLKNIIDSKLVSDLSNSNVSYSQIANFEPSKETTDTVFDNGGNIKGDAVNTNVSESTIPVGGLVQSSSPAPQNAYPNIFLIVVAIGLLSLPFVFKSQPKIVVTRSENAGDDEKILELSQKADGAIVLSFMGRECRVSKPELDSESDQFIERLLGLVTPGIKEIDYDASKDGQANLSAPLSKLVTRLGFVGIKRDLFFPRTSKNRVLFRRYLTQEDLAAMNISIGQLTHELLAEN